jgi:hypothetical protein
MYVGILNCIEQSVFVQYNQTVAKVGYYLQIL